MRHDVPSRWMTVLTLAGALLTGLASVTAVRAGSAQASMPDEAGSLDPAFGNGGIVRADLGRGHDAASALGLMTDGRIYLGGDYYQGFALARYRRDGTPDPSFGDGGAVKVGVRNGSVSSILIAEDGGAFVTGPSDAGSILRFAPDGALDPTFGDEGRVETGIQYLQHLAMSGDGILVGGEDYRHYYQGDESDLVIIRLELDGSVDPRFGDGGTIRLTNRYVGGARALAIQADGKIIAASSSRGRMLVFRFTPEGRFDRSFGERGIVSLGGRYPIPEALVVGADGAITVAGTEVALNGDDDILLVRFDHLGRLDPDFGIDGRVHLDLLGAEVAEDLILRPDGRLVIAGSFEAFDLSAGGSLVARFNADGSLDDSFGEGGILIADRLELAGDLIAQPDGGLVAAGGSSGDHAMIRLLPDGRFDRSFGDDGWVVRNYGFGIDQLGDVLVQPDGKIVVVGYDDRGAFVGRFTTGGTPDPTFGIEGISYLDQPPDRFGDPLQGAFGLALTADGNIVVGGEFGGPFGLIQVSPTGELDRSFGEDGVASATFGRRYATLNALTIQADGKIVASGRATGRRGVVSAIARFDPDGQPDASFGHAGKVTTASEVNGILALEIQPDGRLVGVGWASHGFAVARYLVDGTLDPSFDEDGRLVTRLGRGSGASAMVIQPDGRIVVAGRSTTPGSSSFAIARYTSDGALDPTFGHGGTVATDMGRGNERVSDVVIAPDGTIIAVGGGLNGDGPAIAIVRYGPNGTLDASFGDGGKTFTKVGKGLEWAYAVALGPEGRFVIAGFAQRDSLMCRYIA